MCTAHPARLGGVVAVHMVSDISNSACQLAVGEALSEHTFLAMEIAVFASLTGNVMACAGTAVATMKATSEVLNRNRLPLPSLDQLHNIANVPKGFRQPCGHRRRHPHR